MWDGFNKRKFPRVQVRCDVVVAATSQKKPLSTMTDNLGVGGVALVLPCEIKRFEICAVTLNLSDDPQKPIKCKAKAVWVIPTQVSKSKKQSYDVGLEFLEMHASASDRIKSFLDKHCSENKS